MTHITPLAALYLLLGLASAVTLALRRDIPTSAVELGLLCLFWPLYGPFVLLKFVEQEPHCGEPGTPPKSTGDLQHDGVERVLEALRRAGDAPLASLLPDVHTGRKLAGRLHTASEHVAEIDALQLSMLASTLCASIRAGNDSARSHSCFCAHTRVTGLYLLAFVVKPFASQMRQL